MYGRGAAVSKSDFATYTWALLALRAAVAEGARLDGTLELHFTYDEEVSGELGAWASAAAEIAKKASAVIDLRNCWTMVTPPRCFLRLVDRPFFQ